MMKDEKIEVEAAQLRETEELLEERKGGKHKDEATLEGRRGEHVALVREGETCSMKIEEQGEELEYPEELKRCKQEPVAAPQSQVCVPGAPAPQGPAAT